MAPHQPPYSDEQLETQYSARKAVPEHPAIFQRWAAQSARYRANTAFLPDQAYGSDARQCYDLFPCEKESTHTLPPLLVFLHGGYWQAMDKSDSSFIARHWNRLGCAVAIVNYRLCPDHSVEDAVQDTQQAMAHLVGRENPPYDPARIHVCGHSAGGHLATMLLASNQSDSGPEAGTVRPGSITSISGLFDLQPLLPTTINIALQLDSKTAQRISPVHLQPEFRGPVRLWVGGLESDEFQRQSSDLIAAWQTSVPDTSYRVLPGQHHFSMVEQLDDPQSPLFQELARCMGLTVKPE